jgi:hypothetical protein
MVMPSGSGAIRLSHQPDDIMPGTEENMKRRQGEGSGPDEQQFQRHLATRDEIKTAMEPA